MGGAPGGGARGPRIGILGGTFDPVHVGHLSAAVEVRAALGLDRMLLVVANLPWQKVGERAVTPAEDRFAVVAAAAAEVEGLEASRMEIDRGGPSYTADTAAELARLHPGASLFLVVGSDVAGELATWEREAELRAAVTLVVVRRPGVAVVPPPPPWRAEAVTIPTLDVSSSDLRARAATGRPLEVLVPPAALREIRRRGLYAG
ncbi:MAG: nicotinate-nucleotide adenylyltransferase [Acidimicrobiia bacterium]